MRGRIRKSAEGNPDLQRALPILDLPVSTAFALSMLLIPLVYEQAPRLILAIIGIVTLIPAVVILRRLLLRNAYHHDEIEADRKEHRWRPDFLQLFDEKCGET